MSVLNTGLQLEITIDNVVTFITALSPIILTIFFLLNSALNFDIRGFLWLLGLLVTEMIRLALRAMLKHEKPSKYANINFCSVFEDPFGLVHGHYTMPSFHGTFHGYTISYLLYGIMNNPKSPGIPFISTLVLVALLDFLYRFKNGCEDMVSIFVGVLYGILMGFGAATVVSGAFGKENRHKNIYFGKQDKLKQCSIDNKKYSCKVKKKVTI